MTRLAGLVEAVLELHQPTKTWSIGAKPDSCRQCHTTYPCPTVELIADATGSPLPEQRTTACDGAVRVDDGWTHCLLDRGHHLDGSDCANADGATGPYIDMKELFGVG